MSSRVERYENCIQSKLNKLIQDLSGHEPIEFPIVVGLDKNISIEDNEKNRLVAISTLLLLGYRIISCKKIKFE